MEMMALPARQGLPVPAEQQDPQDRPAQQVVLVRQGLPDQVVLLVLLMT
jgi:hypothetical protein